MGLIPTPTLLLGQSPPRAMLRRTQASRVSQLSAAATYKPPPPGALVEGKIVTCVVIGPAPEPVNYSYLVDIGTPQPALLPAGEVCLLPNATRGQGYRKLEPGEVYEGQILAAVDNEVNISLARVQRSVAWKRVQQLEAEDIAYNATVLKLSDAGATVAVEQLAAFVPWSHWRLPGGTPGQLPTELDTLIGSELPVKFLEVDPQRRTLVVRHSLPFAGAPQTLDEQHRPARRFTGHYSYCRTITHPFSFR